MDNRSLNVDIRREVPGLHPGLNDLIRVLGKQAHCSSRTVIVCEPVCPKQSYSESKYHKNCGSPKKGRSVDSLCRPSSLWSPVRPDTYYYDCFFYRQYPDRDSEYQEIEDKYNAIKQQKLDYSPPECDEDKIKAIVSGVNLIRAGGSKYTTLGEMSKSSTGKGARGWKKGGVEDDWSGPEKYKNGDNDGESAMGSARNPKYTSGGSKRNIQQDEDSVPCAELAEIRDLLKKSDRETIRRMQEMLTLMKELSVRDICRATCDGSLPAGRLKGDGPRSARSEDDMYTTQGSKSRLGQGIDPRNIKTNVSDHELQDKKMHYQKRGESMREGEEPDVYEDNGVKKGYWQDDYDYEPDRSMKGHKRRDKEYGQKGPKKINQRRDEEFEQLRPEKTYQQMADDNDGDDYEPQGPQKRRTDYDYDPQERQKGYQRKDDDYEAEGSMKVHQQRDGKYGPHKSKNLSQRDSESLKRQKRGEYDNEDDNNYDNFERQEYETSYQKRKKPKKNKRGADEGRESISSYQQRDPSQRGKRNKVGDEIPAEFYGEYDEDKSGSQIDLDIQEPRSLQRNLASTRRSRGKLDYDNESLTSTSSDRSRTITRGKKPASKEGERRDRNTISESDTDLTVSSSSYSESSTTDVSGRAKDGESGFESSDTDDFEALGKTGSSRSLKRHQDGSVSSSQASLSKGSESSLSHSQRKDPFRTGLPPVQKSSKQSRLRGSVSTGAPVQPGQGGNYKIPIGKKNVPLTVHEVVELSNYITDVLVLEVINELIRRGLYSPPSTRHLQEPRATVPISSAEGSIESSSFSKQKKNDQTAFDGRRGPSGYKETGRDVEMMAMGPTTRLSRIDESSSRTGLRKDASGKIASSRDMKEERKQHSGESRRSSCPRHSKSLSPSTSSQRRSSSCRLEIERRAKSEGERDKATLRPKDIIPPKPWERRLSSQMKVDSMREMSKAPAKGRSDIPESPGASISSQRSKPDSYKPTSRQYDTGSLKDGSLPGQPPSLPGSRQNVQESSPRSTREYEGPPQNISGMPGSRGTSIGSQISKTKSYRSETTRPEQVSLKDGISTGHPSTVPRSMQDLQEKSPRSSRQYDGSNVPGKREVSISSQQSKIGSHRAPSTRSAQSSLKDGSLPKSRQTSITSRMSKQSSKRSSLAPRNNDICTPDIQEDSSVGRTRIVETVGSGKVPSGSGFPKENSRPAGILKDNSLSGEKILEPEPLQVPSAPKFQQDKTPSIQKMLDPRVIGQPMMMTEGEHSKGRVVQTSRPEHINMHVPELEPTDARAMPPTSHQPSDPCKPCQPDDLVATNYDTDNTTLYYARLTNNAFPPVKESFHAAGFMLRSAYNYDIPPRSKISIKTDLLMQLPRNSYGRIAPRKCLVENYGIDVGADVIDRDYKDNITVVLFNHGDQTFTVERGNKVAQLICESIHLAKVVENNNLLK